MANMFDWFRERLIDIIAYWWEGDPFQGFWNAHTTGAKW